MVGERGKGQPEVSGQSLSGDRKGVSPMNRCFWKRGQKRGEKRGQSYELMFLRKGVSPII